MLFLFRSAPEVEKRIHSKLFRKFWRSRGTKEPAYITVVDIKSERFVKSTCLQQDLFDMTMVTIMFDTKPPKVKVSLRGQ
jgi:hypothetical protein